MSRRGAVTALTYEQRDRGGLVYSWICRVQNEEKQQEVYVPSSSSSSPAALAGRLSPAQVITLAGRAHHPCASVHV